MDKIYVKHYILATYGEEDTANYRTVDMSEITDTYRLVAARIKKAMLSNGIEEPEKLISYSFRMLGDSVDGVFQRKELVDIDLELLEQDLVGFPWENWGWVQAFQPVIDVAGFTIAEIDSEYKSFGPTLGGDGDHISPCYRIYEGGVKDYRPDGIAGQKQKEKAPEPKSWFQRLQQDLIDPVANVVKDNIPTLLAVGTTVTAVVVMYRTSSEAVHAVEEASMHNHELLRHIEQSIDDAIDMPQIVKVELGEDIEVIGTGHKAW